jgi:hypothetical protein
MMKPTTKLRIPRFSSQQTRSVKQAEILTLALLLRKNLPPGHNDIVEYLQAQVCNLSAQGDILRWMGRTFRLRICSILQDLIDQ